MKSSQNTVRFTMDMTLERHTHIKMMAAKENISMKEYIDNRLSGHSNSRDLSDNEFKMILHRIIKVHGKELKELANR